MYPNLGDFATGKTIFFPFHTFAAAGGSVTLTGLAVTDIEVYKNASMTQRSSDAGYALVDTDGIDLDGITGIHGFTIDTSDNTDAGFFAAGNDYTVVVSAVTVDSQTVNFIAGRFSIDNRSTAVMATASAVSTLQTTANTIAGYIDTEVAAILAAVDTEVAAILALLNSARAEPGQGAPAVNANMATKVDYLYKAWRNRVTQTATAYSLYADDGTTVDQKATTADDGTTYSRTEIVTGP
jgi:hypothetical protein